MHPMPYTIHDHSRQNYGDVDVFECFRCLGGLQNKKPTHNSGMAFNKSDSNRSYNSEA